MHSINDLDRGGHSSTVIYNGLNGSDKLSRGEIDPHFDGRLLPREF